MRAYKRYGKRAFTLVELMIVVAIIGVLAALAIYGVRRYMASAKTSEAKNTIGAISRAAAAAYERENAASEILAPGDTSSGTNNQLCNAAAAVPGAVPQGTKYQPAEADWGGADDVTGWRCLKFSVTQPIYYQYHYTRETNVPNQTTPVTHIGTEWFEAGAVGDLDGDNTDFSVFVRGGDVDTATRQLVVATQVHIENEYE
jgi:type IV pilus assembly protein PilA